MIMFVDMASANQQFIRIEPVTSLADLEFKAKADKHYQQLAILGCNSITFGESRIKTFKNAMKKLYDIAASNDTKTLPNGCEFMMLYLNDNCGNIKPEPIVSCVSKLVKTNPQRIVDNLKKRKVALKKKRGV